MKKKWILILVIFLLFICKYIDAWNKCSINEYHKGISSYIQIKENINLNIFDSIKLSINIPCEENFWNKSNGNLYTTKLQLYSSNSKISKGVAYAVRNSEDILTIVIDVGIKKNTKFYTLQIRREFSIVKNEFKVLNGGSIIEERE
mgnify:FL=1